MCEGNLSLSLEYVNKQLCNRKVRDFAVVLQARKVSGAFEKQVPGPRFSKKKHDLELNSYRAVLLIYSEYVERFPSFKKFQAYTLLGSWFYGPKNFPGAPGDKPQCVTQQVTQHATCSNKVSRKTIKYTYIKQIKKLYSPPFFKAE